MDGQSVSQMKVNTHFRNTQRKEARASKCRRMNGWQRNESDLDGVSVWLKEFACGPSEWLVNFPLKRRQLPALEGN